MGFDKVAIVNWSMKISNYFSFFLVKQVPFDVPMSDNNGFYRPLCRSVTVRFALNVCLHAHCACVCVHYSKGMIGMHALSKLVVLLSSVFYFLHHSLSLSSSVSLSRSRLFHPTTKLEFAITTKTIKSKQ